MKHFRSPHAARRAIKARLCLAAVVACTGAGLAQAGIVTDPGGMALANCPLAAFQYVCVVEGRARVDGITAAPIEKVRISRTAGYHNGATLTVGADAVLTLNSVASVVDNQADLVVGDNVGAAGTLAVVDGGKIEINVPVTTSGGLFIGVFAAPLDAPAGLGGSPLPSTRAFISGGGMVTVNKGGGPFAGSAVGVGVATGSHSSLVLDGGIGNFGSPALGATLTTTGNLSIGREGSGAVSLVRNANLSAHTTYLSVVSASGVSTLDVGFQSTLSGEVVAGIGRNPVTLLPDPTVAEHGRAVIDVRTAGAILGQVTLGQGGTLRGSGFVAGLVNHGGVVAPGNSPGTLTIGAGGYVDNGGDLHIEFGGSGQDRLVVEGPVALNGTAIEFSFIEGFAPAAGTSFEFLSAGNAAPTLTGVQYSYTGLEPGFEFEVSTGGDGRLVFTALTNGVSVVPEPAAWWLAAFGLGLLYLVPKMRSPASPRPGTM
ncbi:MAG: hypothetical protein H7Z19_00300 [Chitinophagaceae bacterium]|nr:hypothetical protein [Rubrivivax sp.]